MQSKKFMTIVCSLALILTMSLSALAVSSDDTEAINKPKRPAMTDEQKVEMKAKRKLMKAKFDLTKEKWTALTEAQKSEIYELKDEVNDIESQIIDKYLEFGVIDKETKSNIKEKLILQKDKMRQEDRMPMFGGKRGGFQKSIKDGKM